VIFKIRLNYILDTYLHIQYTYLQTHTYIGLWQMFYRCLRCDRFLALPMMLCNMFIYSMLILPGPNIQETIFLVDTWPSIFHWHDHHDKVYVHIVLYISCMYHVLQSVMNHVSATCFFHELVAWCHIPCLGDFVEQINFQN